MFRARMIALAVLGPALLGCGINSEMARFVQESHRAYEAEALRPVTKTRLVMRSSVARPAVATRRRTPAQAAAPEALYTGSISRHDSTPVVGSPQAEFERIETERRDLEVKRRMEGVCRAC